MKTVRVWTDKATVWLFWVKRLAHIQRCCRQGGPHQSWGIYINSWHLTSASVLITKWCGDHKDSKNHSTATKPRWMERCGLCPKPNKLSFSQLTRKQMTLSEWDWELVTRGKAETSAKTGNSPHTSPSRVKCSAPSCSRRTNMTSDMTQTSLTIFLTLTIHIGRKSTVLQSCAQRT